ncbi:hypothetical protein [Rhodococcus globerulus]|uniref:hypothetical protein n=1 Tax=Rhodococcus globerulus TaxID=33008 RepID=UPI000AC2F1B8|nr:hypothetical protein [Rhodococcus globerulus]
MDFDSTADELYALDPSEFIGARRAAVARAKELGDTTLAKNLNALRKPTTTGWALNLLVRVEPESVDRLLELGAALRSAQQALRAGELRSLASRRAAVISALTERASSAARDRGRPLSETVMREIGQSLSAALSEPDIGADLRRGRMLGSVSYSGFGPAALASVPEPIAPPPTDAEPKGQQTEAARKQAQARVSEAETAAHQATSELDSATARVNEAAQKVSDLREALSQAEQEFRFAESARRTAEEAAERAATKLTQARDLAAEFDT